MLSRAFLDIQDVLATSDEMSYLDSLRLRLLSSADEALESEVEEKNREVPSSSRRRSTIHLSSSSSTPRFEVGNTVWTHHGAVTGSHINRTQSTRPPRVIVQKQPGVEVEITRYRVVMDWRRRMGARI